MSKFIKYLAVFGIGVYGGIELVTWSLARMVKHCGDDLESQKRLDRVIKIAYKENPDVFDQIFYDTVQGYKTNKNPKEEETNAGEN